jgi:hypothetical protein
MQNVILTSGFMLLVVAVWLYDNLILMKRNLPVSPLLEQLDNQHNIKLIITGTAKIGTI